MSSPPARRFVALVPVKSPARGKSRLTGISDDLRRDLAVAFALDTMDAVCATSGVAEVVVVTGDPSVVERAAPLGCSVEPDRGDLNRSLVAAAASLAGRRPELQPVAVCADLPALRPGDLAAALAATGTRAVVADTAGTGTTLLAAAPGVPLRPTFGPGSLVAHRLSGAVELPGAPGLRRDVDTPEDLRAALSLGVGPSTRAAADAVLPVEVGCSPPAGTMLP